MRAVLISRDVTERRRAEEAARVATERLHTLLANLPIVLFSVESDGTVTLCEGKGLEASGVKPSDFVGRNLTDLYKGMLREHPKIQEVVEHVFAGKPYTGLMEFRGTVGETRFLPILDAQGRLERVIGVAYDVTARIRAEQERQRFETQAWHAQKLESLGMLAGGIAHDFNNLLAVILGHADLALKELAPGASARSNVAHVSQAARRAAELTNQLLAYAGRGQAAPQAIDLSKLVESNVELLQVSLAKKAELRWDLAEDLPLVHGDPGRITQVILNLITNAGEALGEERGSITIRTRVVEVDEDWQSRSYPPGTLAPGPHVCLEVIDTGCGIDAASRERIFEPFFTTKPAGHGLGLAAVLGIVRAHRGAVAVESEAGKGTTFRALFPAVERGPGAFAGASVEPGSWRARGTVLVVDDEDDVREVAGQMLARLGFDVVCIADPREALAEIRARAGEIAAVVLDLSMSEMSGEETFRKLRGIGPDIPVVFMSGYAEPLSAYWLGGKRRAEFLPKPFTSEELAEAVRRVVQADVSGTGP
jgi:PAS domain S-box-containing protein